MSPAPKANTAPPSPFLQVATPPESSPWLLPLWEVDEDDRKQVLVDAIRQVLTDETSAPLHFNANRRARPLEAIPGTTDVPPNTPWTHHLDSMAMDEGKQPLDLMVPSPIDPIGNADWITATADHCLSVSTQTQTDSDSALSEAVTMGQLKELLLSILKSNSQPAVPLVPAMSEDNNKGKETEDEAARPAAREVETGFKKVMEMYVEHIFSNLRG
jgi:hypothetical protein